MFYITHTRKDGISVDLTSVDKISHMQGLVNDLSEDCKNSTVEESSEVMGLNGHGRVKTMGLGAKPNTVWGPQPTRQQLEREVSESLRDVAEVRWVAHESMTTLASIISQRLSGTPVDIDAILRGIFTHDPLEGIHSAPVGSGDPLGLNTWRC